MNLLVCVCPLVKPDQGVAFRCPEHGEMMVTGNGEVVTVRVGDQSLPPVVYFTVSEESNVWAEMVSSTVYEKKEIFRSTLPNRATTQAAGYDLRAYLPQGPMLLPPLSVVMVSTGLRMAMPKDWAALVCSRSGLASKGVLVINAPGIIDSDYRDEVKVLLSYIAAPDAPPFRIEHGMRVAQLLFQPPYHHPELLQSDTLPPADSNRNGGFGSTGIA